MLLTTTESIMASKQSIVRKMSTASRKVIKALEDHQIPHFITGSRSWGVATPESDYDICIMFDHTGDIQSLINQIIREEYHLKVSPAKLILEAFGTGDSKYTEPEYEKSNYGAGLKVNIGGDIINLVRLLPGDFLFWAHSTQFLNNACEINPIPLSDKTFRHGIFEQLRAVSKMTITYDNWEYDSEGMIKILTKLGLW